MIDSVELLAAWPSWRKTSADKVLASPAWRMEVSFARIKDRLLIDNTLASAEDEIHLKITLDDVEHVLGIHDSDVYPDLHRVWAMKDRLDKNIILALIEKECGLLFVLLEHVFGHDVKVKGLAEEDSPAKATRTVFKTSRFVFSIDLSTEMRVSLGDISYLDTKHDSIRTMTRPACEDYAAFEMREEEIAALQEGDVLLPPSDYLEKASWSLEAFADDKLHVVGSGEKALRFADFADETLPTISAPDKVLFIRNTTILAEGELHDLGGIKCFRLTRMLS